MSTEWRPYFSDNLRSYGHRHAWNFHDVPCCRGIPEEGRQRKGPCRNRWTYHQHKCPSALRSKLVSNPCCRCEGVSLASLSEVFALFGLLLCNLILVDFSYQHIHTWVVLTVKFELVTRTKWLDVADHLDFIYVYIPEAVF